VGLLNYWHLLTLGPFLILCCVGTGTFGRVVLAQNNSTYDYGALKILSLADVIRLKQVEHVRNERDILRQVNHPFIVNL